MDSSGLVASTRLHQAALLPSRVVDLDNTPFRLARLRESVVLALAWTIADLAGRDVPGDDELAIALAMRRGEQPGAVKPQAV